MAVGCLVTTLLLITVTMVMGGISNLALNKTQWWSVDLENVAKINNIHLYPYAWDRGYYSHVVVYTRKLNSGKWSVCKHLGKPKKPKQPKGKYFVVVCNRTTVARYVSVAFRDKKPLYLAAVKVYGTYVKDINFALDRPSSQSSVSPYGYCRSISCGASKSNDGRIETNSVTNNKKSPEWWSVYLGDLIKINNIRLYLSQYPHAWRKGYYSHVVVSTAKVPGKWSVCKDLGKLTKPKVLKGKYFVVECSQPTVARYVKVSLFNNKPLYLAEVKVYGTFVKVHPN